MLSILFLILAFIVAIVFHEVAHGWMANRLGDPTAKLMGRLSLNPIKHYDPLGTTLLLVLVFLRAVTQNPAIIPFGWAKPVVIDPYNLRDPKKDSALVSLAGPATNFIIAIIAGVFYHIFSNPFSPLYILSGLFYALILLNIALGLFNLIPIHPLDGGKILVGILPDKDAREADLFLKRYGIFILILLIFPIFGSISPISYIFGPVFNFLLKILAPGNPVV
jgi:Zn-dependent protease